MIIKNLYSACIQITTKNLTILCDPWFSQGIADGSWYLFSEPKNALRCIDDPDLIYISHIHNDHYDSKFLNKLFLKFGKKKIIIPKFKKNYLEIRAKLDGFDVQAIDKLSVKKTNIHIIPNDQSNPADVDSALFVNCEITKKNMINLNDSTYGVPH